MATGDRPPRFSPPTLTIGSLLLLWLAGLIVGYAADDGTAASERFVGSVEWSTWVFLAGASVAVFAVMLVLGLRAIIRPSPDWGLASAPAARRYGYLASAALFMAALIVVTLAGEPWPAAADLPVQHPTWRTRGVLITGYLAAIPWLTLVWLAHAECARLKAAIVDRHPDETTKSIQETVKHLSQLWRLMTYGVTAAAISIVIAIVTAGALRAAFIAHAPDRAGEFPGSVVLLFGGLFAVLQAAIGLPLVASWRARARDLVEQAHPLPEDGRPTESWVADRARLEALLHLDVPLLRNPLAALSIFVPTITSLLAVFIPDLANR